MVLGSFGVVTLVAGRGDAAHDLNTYRGLSSRRPGLALTFTVFLMAQAGVPFTSGFLAKFYVISSAVQSHSYALAIIAMLAAAVAAFFYLRVIVLMYSPAGEGDAGEAAEAASEGSAAGGAVAVAVVPRTDRITIPGTTGVALAIALVFTVGVGLFPGPVIDFARNAVLLH
jgi:NADH-quinone oxidoreductase subunit N